MWAVIKFDKKKLNLMISDLKKKCGKDIIIYQPKILVQNFKKNKLIFREHNVLGDYIFCFHKNFTKKKDIDNLNFLRGLKYFLNGFKEFQSDIKAFIGKCKGLENSQGYICESLFELQVNTSYKFNSGPFVNKIFKIIDFEKNKIKILTGNLKTIINKNQYLFNPV